LSPSVPPPCSWSSALEPTFGGCRHRPRRLLAPCACRLTNFQAWIANDPDQLQRPETDGNDPPSNHRAASVGRQCFHQHENSLSQTPPRMRVLSRPVRSRHNTSRVQPKPFAEAKTGTGLLCPFPEGEGPSTPTRRLTEPLVVPNSLLYGEPRSVVPGDRSPSPEPRRCCHQRASNHHQSFETTHPRT
jgi:hypothetical protein